MGKVVGIIQARLGSSRFPGKVLDQIEGKPMLWHVVNRTQKASSLDQIVVAIPDGIEDDPLAKYCSFQGMECLGLSESLKKNLPNNYHKLNTDSRKSTCARMGPYKARRSTG